MSRLIARILLTILIFPAATLFYFVAYILIDRWTSGGSEYNLVIATLLTCGFMAGYWLMLWLRSVNWTRRRIGRTVWSVGIAIFGGGLIGWVVQRALQY